MQAELATAAPRPPLRLSWRRSAGLILPAVILVTLIFELALAERKYALFGGGFGQSQALDAPLEIGAFAATLLACQTLLFYLLYRLVRRLHGRGAGSPFFHINFLFLVGGGAIAAVIAKYEALAYFSDAMSLQIVRNLGGGSLGQAVLYSLSEAGLMLLCAGGALLVYTGALLMLRRRWRDIPPVEDNIRLNGRQILLAAGAVALLLFGANRVPDARPALARFNSVTAVTAVLHQATDFDRDGWSFYSYPLDRQPLDGSRHPYALDVPNNGVDEDGFGGDLLFSETIEAARPPLFAGRKRHVILIVLESTRADAIGRVVDGIPVTPHLTALARRGTMASHAYSHVGFTTQSLQSLFSGEMAPSDDRQSLVRDFAANGYRTAVFSGQSEDFGDTARITGMRRADIFVDARTLREERASTFAAEASLNLDGKILLREFDRHLGRAEAWRRPNFLYFNLQSAHFPYAFAGTDRILPGEPIPRGRISAANRLWVERTYWNAIAYNDRLIGALITRLRRLGALDDALIVVTADHGESLFDDGFLGHGHALNAQQTQIPFIVSDPGAPLPSPLGLADMRAEILAAAGARVPQNPNRGVFQYLGSLDRPGSIGTVDHAGNWTVFNLFTEALWTTRSGRWRSYAELQGADKSAADRLTEQWARERWRQRLRSQRN